MNRHNAQIKRDRKTTKNVVEQLIFRSGNKELKRKSDLFFEVIDGLDKFVESKNLTLEEEWLIRFESKQNRLKNHDEAELLLETLYEVRLPYLHVVDQFEKEWNPLKETFNEFANAAICVQVSLLQHPKFTPESFFQRCSSAE